MNDLPCKIQPVYDALDDGATCSELAEIFSEKTRRHALGYISTNHPDAFDHFFGPPAVDRPIIIDECISHNIAVMVHQNFGRSHFIAHAGKGGIKDKGVYAYAAEQRALAILTFDGADRTPKDLSVIACKAFAGRQAGSSALCDNHCPGIVVLPSRDLTETVNNLFKRAEEIKAYINTYPVNVLDFREFRFGRPKFDERVRVPITSGPTLEKPLQDNSGLNIG